MSAAIDSSALVALSSVQRLDIARATVGELWIPEAVFHEVVSNGGGWIQAGEAQTEIARGVWIKRKPAIIPAIVPPFLQKLGAGEKDVILLAQQNDIELVLDDLAGRQAAVFCGQKGRLTGSLGILMKAKRIGHISSIEPVIEAIRSQGIYYAPNLIRECLKEVGEI